MTRIGLFGIGLDTYWVQFSGLLDNLKKYQDQIKTKILSYGVEVIDAGMVDNPSEARLAAEFFRKHDLEVIFLYVSTYALSSTVLPIAQKLKVPVGIISSSWGGTRVEQWTPPTSYQQSPLFKDTVSGRKNFKIDGMIPGKMFEGMIKPLIPYTMKGLIWYQGESNLMIHDTTTFVAKTKLMLDTWKSLWKDESLRFYYTQIAPYYYSKRKDKLAHGTDLLPYYWEAQAQCLAFPNSGMAVTTDLVDDLNNIHPSYKWEVGRRLSLWALAKDYGHKVVYSGPLYKSMTMKKNRIELSFTEAGSGLISEDGKALTWFSIAGADHKFYLAEAVVKGKKLIVSSKDVPNPVAVRFAWDETAMPNFCNNEKLPVSPFRTDNWK